MEIIFKMKILYMYFVVDLMVSRDGNFIESENLIFCGRFNA